jgi:plasmid stabilization system protein ParE
MTTDQARLAQELDSTLRDIFARYGRSALWSKRLPEETSPDLARAVAYTLRREGPAAARRLAERIEELSDAIDHAAARHS